MSHSTPFRYFQLAIAVIVLFLAGCQKSNPDSTASQHTEAVTNEPITVAMTSEGYIYYWHLEIDSKGNAWVARDSKLKKRKFKVSEGQLSLLRQALLKERFFELGDTYGDNVPDGGASRIRITQGKRKKMVTLLFMGNWERENHRKLAEAQRAERIWDLIKRWSE